MDSEHIEQVVVVDPDPIRAEIIAVLVSEDSLLSQICAELRMESPQSNYRSTSGPSGRPSCGTT
jgi:predicted metalloenzyme YecM